MWTYYTDLIALFDYYYGYLFDLAQLPPLGSNY